ncbi:MAG: GerW family sporulation protein [Lachnospirales bacterium]
MANEFNESLGVLLSKMESFVSSKTVVGEPITIDGVIIVPLVDVMVGVGAGAGDSIDTKEEKNGKSNSVGGGLGAKITPSAILVINSGNVQLVNVKDQDSINKIIDMVPSILQKFNIGTKEETEETTKTEEAETSSDSTTL